MRWDGRGRRYYADGLLCLLRRRGGIFEHCKTITPSLPADAEKARRGNTIVALPPASLRHADIGVDKGRLRNRRGLVEGLGGAKRVPGRHAGVKNNALFYVHEEARAQGGGKGAAQER